jgi:integrase
VSYLKRFARTCQTWFLAATGARIGEACALSWEDVDFLEGTVHLHGTVIRLRGAGLVIGRPKSNMSDRIVEPPSWCMAMLLDRERRRTDHQRRDGTTADMVFPSPRANEIRDPSNTRRWLRTALEEVNFPGVTSHTFRKTVATLMDEAGRTPRETADQLGHAHPSLTLDVYMGRRRRATGAAQVLEQLG